MVLEELFLGGIKGKRTMLIWEVKQIKSLFKFLPLDSKHESLKCISSKELSSLRQKNHPHPRLLLLIEIFYLQSAKNRQGWKESGRRVKRGLYRTGLQNWYINADCNGAANIIRKVATRLGLDLSGVGRGVLTAPSRVR